MNSSDYIVFVDESGDHSSEVIDVKYPVFVLCFCVFHKSIYENGAIPLINQLKLNTFKTIDVVLHETDIKRKKGAFSKLNKEAREQFLESLDQLIDGLDFTLIAVVIDKAKHKDRYNYPDHPYHLAMQYGLERVYSHLKQCGEMDKELEVICEARGTKEDKELERAFRIVCAGKNRATKKLSFKIKITNKQSNSTGLQISDLIARPIGLSVFRPNQPNKAYETIKKKFYGGYYGFINGNGRKIFP